jgi:hypothetical protein
MPRRAFVFWSGSICVVIDEEVRNLIVATSINFRRATRAARRRGYDVIVYKNSHANYATPPQDAVQVSSESYVLPAVGVGELP